MTPVLFLVAAGAGSIVRWRVGLALPRPLGTIAVNVIGAFGLGLIDHWSAPELTVIGIGGLGAMTTFSTLSDDIVGLAVRRPLAATAYVVITVAGGLAAAAVGMALGG